MMNDHKLTARHVVVQDWDGEPTSEEIAKRMDIPVAKSGKSEDAQDAISLETPIGEKKIRPWRLHRRPRGSFPAEAVINVNLKDQTGQVLRTRLLAKRSHQNALRPGRRKRATLWKKSAVVCGNSRTHSPDRAKALRKLRHPSRSRKLRAFMDGLETDFSRRSPQINAD